MKLKLKNGRMYNVNPANYLIDWDRKVSGPQKKTKDFLYPYWKTHVVCEELFIRPYRIDIVNLTLGIFLEVSPDEVHLKYNPFMHGGHATGYVKKLKADEEKRLIAEDNNFQYIELNNEHLNNLSKEMFAAVFDLHL